MQDEVLRLMLQAQNLMLPYVGYLQSTGVPDFGALGAWS